jgi:hypothetical protein
MQTIRIVPNKMTTKQHAVMAAAGVVQDVLVPHKIHISQWGEKLGIPVFSCLLDVKKLMAGCQDASAALFHPSAASHASAEQRNCTLSHFFIGQVNHPPGCCIIEGIFARRNNFLRRRRGRRMTKNRSFLWNIVGLLFISLALGSSASLFCGRLSALKANNSTSTSSNNQMNQERCHCCASQATSEMQLLGRTTPEENRRNVVLSRQEIFLRTAPVRYSSQQMEDLLLLKSNRKYPLTYNRH